MCTGVELGLLMTGVGAAATAINQNQALRRQDKELARGIIEQGRLDKEADARLRNEIADLERSGPEADRKIAMDAFRNALRENQDLAQGAVAGVPGASERFAENVEAGRAAITGRSQTRAQLLSRIDAPIRQRQKETLKLGRLGTDIDDVAQRSASADFLAKLRASQQRPNPFVDALGSFLTSFGASAAVGGGFGGGGTDVAGAAGAGTIIDPGFTPTLPGLDQPPRTILG